MPSLSVDHSLAAQILERAWAAVGDNRVAAPQEVVPLLEELMGSTNVTFKYILVTGLLGKCAEPKVHPRALQMGSTLSYAFDARSLCHRVVVTFEKSKGDLWGLSNEPFVNKPARHPQHDKNNKQLRDKELATTLHDVLDFAHAARPKQVLAMLVHVLRLGKRRAESQVVATALVETTFRRVVDFANRFLQETDGGTRLVAVVGAFLKLLNQGFVVKVYPPNYSDRFARTAGDVEIWDGETIVSAFECKHRPLNIDDVRHGIRKAKGAGVSEYCFVYGAGLAEHQGDAIRKTLVETTDLDVELFDILAVMSSWATLLNPVRRGLLC